MINDILHKISNTEMGGKGADFLAMLTKKLQGMGGLEGILGHFKAAGLHEQADSWVGHGENKPVTPEQTQAALGDDFVNDAASKLGVPPETVSKAAAEAVPEMVDKMTPEGKVPEGGTTDALGRLFGGQVPDFDDLKGMFGGIFGGKQHPKT